jgi:hypothetical protein
MAAGRLDITAGQGLMNNLALMIRSQEITAAAAPHTIVFEGQMIPDLPIEPDDPANPANAHYEPVNPGAQPGADIPTKSVDQAYTPDIKREKVA